MSSTTDGDQSVPHYDLRVLRSLRQITRAVELHSRRLAASHKITAPQLVCLLAIAEKGPLSTSALAKEVHLSPSTVVGILDRLTDKGLAVRERDTHDRRIVNISGTDKGLALARSAPSPLQDELALSLSQLPELEQSTIALSLERVVQLMEAKQLDATPILEVIQTNSST